MRQEREYIEEHPVVSEWIADAPIAIEYDVEGQTIRNETIILGAKAGPSRELSNVLHELAHLIEIDEDRMFAEGWGFKYGTEVTQPVIGTYREFFKAQHIEREVRVWAMQIHLQRAADEYMSIEELTRSARFLPNHWNATKSEVHICEWAAKRVREEADKIDLDVILAELDRRKAILRKQVG